MKIRFAQVAIGQCFTYRGETFTKVNSLIARDAGNRQQLLPRSTTVELLDGAEGSAGAAAASDWPGVREAFEHYHAASLTAIDAVATEKDRAEQAKQALAQARRRFLDALPD